MQLRNTKKKKQKEESSTKKIPKVFTPRKLNRLEITGEKGKPFIVSMDIEGKLDGINPANLGLSFDDTALALHMLTSGEKVIPIMKDSGDGSTVDERLKTERLDKKTIYFDDRDWVTMSDDKEGINWQPHVFEHNVDHIRNPSEVFSSVPSATTHSTPGDISRQNQIRERRLKKIEACTWTRTDRIMEYQDRTYERDGIEVKLYKVRGADFTEEEFLKYFVDEDFTSEEVFRLWNVEQKSSIINEIGWDRMFTDVGAKEIHRRTVESNGIKEEYVLYEIMIDKNRRITARILQVPDSTTGKNHYLGVPKLWKKPIQGDGTFDNPHLSEPSTVDIPLDTCMKAVAWTFGMTEEEYKPKVQT